jgi:hypothetical protein
MSNNWSLNLQTWYDLLNTPISQGPPTPDELADASLLHRQFNASPSCSISTTSIVISPHITILLINTIHLQPVVRRVIMLIHHIHTLLPSMWFVGWSCSYTLFISSTFIMFIPSTSTYSLWRWWQLGGGKNTSHTTKAPSRMKKKMSRPTVTRKNWYFSILSFYCPLFDYYVVFTKLVYKFILDWCIPYIALKATPNLEQNSGVSFLTHTTSPLICTVNELLRI